MTKCPKCKDGKMAYLPGASTGFYACADCSWIETTNPPWPKSPSRPWGSNPNLISDNDMRRFAKANG